MSNGQTFQEYLQNTLVVVRKFNNELADIHPPTGDFFRTRKVEDLGEALNEMNNFSAKLSESVSDMLRIRAIILDQTAARGDDYTNKKVKDLSYRAVNLIDGTVSAYREKIHHAERILRTTRSINFYGGY